MLKLFLLFLLLVLGAPVYGVSTSGSAKNISQQQIDLLRLGMGHIEVAAILGEPQTKLTRGLVSRWDYAFDGEELTVWFGSQGLRNAYGSNFSTFHLVTPPEGYTAPKQYDVESDPNRKVVIKEEEPKQLLSEEDSVFTPLLPEQDVLNSVERWRKARESRRVRDYVANYAPNYSTSSRISHKQWLERVKKSMSKATFIKVELSNIKSNFVHSKRVLVTFVQKYRSNRYSDKVKKQLQYDYIDGQWLISKEQTLAKLR